MDVHEIFESNDTNVTATGKTCSFANSYPTTTPPDNTGKYIAAAICITLLIIGICAN